MDVEKMAMEELIRCGRLVAHVPITVKWDVEGTYGGWCKGVPVDGRWVLRFNRVLAEQEGPRYRATVAHEFAHACAAQAGEKMGHGPIWQGYMMVFGFEPRVSHEYQVPSSARRPFAFVCGCKTHFVSAILARRIKSGRRYTCRACGSVLRERAEQSAASLRDELEAMK